MASIKRAKRKENNATFKNTPFEKDKPVGVLSRALDNSNAKELLGWEPKFSLKEGLDKTIEWYLKTHKTSGEVNDSALLEHDFPDQRT